MISGNITTISNHLPQFLFAPNIIERIHDRETIFKKEIGQNFIQIDFVLDYFDKDWPNALKLDQQDVNLSIVCFF